MSWDIKERLGVRMPKTEDQARHDQFCARLNKKLGNGEHCNCMRGRGAQPAERVKELLDALLKALDEMREAEGGAVVPE